PDPVGAAGGATRRVPRLGPVRVSQSPERPDQPLAVATIRLEREHLEARADRPGEHRRGVADVRADIEDVAAAEEVWTPARQGRERIAQTLVREVRSDEEIRHHRV